MAAQLDAQGLAWKRVGCDFRRLERDAIARWFAQRFPSLRPTARRLSGAELGCWASHLCAWEAIRASGHAAGIVLEDDVLLALDFRDRARALASDPGGFDVVYLGTSSRNLSGRRAALLHGLRVHAPVGVVLNTWAYVVSADWIGRLLDAGPIAIHLPLDHYLGGGGRRAPPRIGVLQPPCVTEDEVTGRASQIGPATRRIDRRPWFEGTRRRLLRSRAGDWYERLCRWM